MDNLTENIPINRIKTSRISELDFDNIKFGRVFTDHIFVLDYFDGQWQNPRLQPQGELHFSPKISAIHYGQSIFEGLKAYKRIDSESIMLFRPKENARRFAESAKRMCMPPVPENIFMQAITQLVLLDKAWIPKGENQFLYIRPVLFATDDYIGIRPSDNYCFVVFACPLGEPYYKEYINVKVEKKYARACAGGTGTAKSAGNYAGALYPAKLAQEQGFDQLLWTDAKEHQYIEESGTMNVMFRIDDTLITAPIGSTVLSGITRDSVLNIARSYGITIEERYLSVNELREAAKEGRLKEVFGTGTAVGIQKIGSVTLDDKKYVIPVSDKELSFAIKLDKALKNIIAGQTNDINKWMLEL